MVAPLLLVALVVLCVAGLAWLALTREHVDETDRFNRARAITNSWADPAALGSDGRAQRVPDDEADSPQR
jgi:hypothetical protein